MFLRSRVLMATAAVATAVPIAPPAAAAGPRPIAGFTPAHAKWQRQKFGRIVVDVSRDTEQALAWQRAADGLQARAETALRAGDTATFRRLNAKIMQTERDLLTDAGLPDRPWPRHQIHASAINDGYATQHLPGLNDALFLDDRPDVARAYEARLYESLRAVTRTLTALRSPRPGGNRLAARPSSARHVRVVSIRSSASMRRRPPPKGWTAT